MPVGPAESPRVREFAETSLRSMPMDALTDKMRFLARMKALDNRILGIQSKEQQYAASMGKKLLAETALASSSVYKANSGSGYVPMTISPDMRVASSSSLEKIRNLRHNVTISLNKNSAFGSERGRGASVQNVPSSASVLNYTECADSTDFSAPADTTTGRTPVKHSTGELKTTGSACSAADMVMNESKMTRGECVVTREKDEEEVDNSGGSASKETGEEAPSAAGADEANQERIRTPAPASEDGIAGASSMSESNKTEVPLSISEEVDPSSRNDAQPHKALYSPKFNEKGELDFSGSYKEHDSIPVKTDARMTASLEESAASVWLVKPDVKKSIDLSGLSLEELKELQGHY